MKLKKLILAAAAVLAASIFITSCDFNGSNSSSAFEIRAYDSLGTEIDFRNGDTHVDPIELCYLELQFPNEMDTTYYDFVSNFWSDTEGYGWVNSYTYIIKPYLIYGMTYNFSINDYDYYNENPDSGYTPNGSFWRTKKRQENTTNLCYLYNKNIN